MISATPMLLGHYRPLDSYLHRLDARAKLAPVVAVMILGLLTDSILFYLVVLSALLAGLMASGIAPGVIGRNFRPVLILVAITFVYHLIFSGHDSRPVFELFGWTVREEALSRAAFFSLRLLLFVSVVFLVTLTSSPSDLAEAVAKLLRPLKKLRVPADDIGLVLFIAIRFIPILHQEFLTIRNAQIIRGVDFSGNLLARARKTTSIIIPVLVAAISRADELALAMEARGYRSGEPRTFFTRTRFDLSSALFALGTTVALLILFGATRA
ncbi:MAG: energy-coupling factor transporter transmembrane component T [Candidatus Zixiibacteriota bacterium]